MKILISGFGYVKESKVMYEPTFSDVFLAIIES